LPSARILGVERCKPLVGGHTIRIPTTSHIGTGVQLSEIARVNGRERENAIDWST